MLLSILTKNTVSHYVMSISRSVQLNSTKCLDEFLDSVHTTLDELWRLPHSYPQNRMVDLINIISSIVIEACIDGLNSVDIWNINSVHTNQALSESMDTTDSWIHICDSLTRLFWPNNAANPWTGGPHIPKNAQLFRERLNEIKVIKNLYTQIATIFNDDDRMDKVIAAMFHPFAGMYPILRLNVVKCAKITSRSDINILDVSPFGAKRWQKAVGQFEAMLQPVDEKMASILKPKLNNHLSNPRQVIMLSIRPQKLKGRSKPNFSTDNSHFLAIRLDSSKTIRYGLVISRTGIVFPINKRLC